jgi:hypothetical protein
MLMTDDECTLTEQKPRRQSPRMPGPFQARFVSGERSVAVTVRDLSTAGCFVEMEMAIGVAQPGGLRIELPVEGWITAQAEIVYRLGRVGIAMKFVDLDDATRDQIMREIVRMLNQDGIIDH